MHINVNVTGKLNVTSHHVIGELSTLVYDVSVLSSSVGPIDLKMFNKYRTTVTRYQALPSLLRYTFSYVKLRIWVDPSVSEFAILEG